MADQRLANYLDGAVAKRLTAVETDSTRSNQHEWNATKEVLGLFGRTVDPKNIWTQFIYLDDDPDGAISTSGTLTLYDARANHETRTEHRIYYRENEVTVRAKPGDLLVIAKPKSADAAIAVIAKADSSAEVQVISLFGLDEVSTSGLKGAQSSYLKLTPVNIARQLTLEALGIQLDVDDDLLALTIEKFGGAFPTTKVFSEFARSTLPEFDLEADPDAAIVAWMEREELLFIGFDQHLLSAELEELINTTTPPRNPAPFQKLMLADQNRAKSRAGHALENHVEFLFAELGVQFDRGAITENNSKPDFLFPGIDEYLNPEFPTERLTMLGAKRTLKDRWRQVLAEAERISNKHLLTLQAPISTKQTDEMQAKNLQLVVPSSLQVDFEPDQKNWLMSLSEFIELVRSREA
jgi:hypothetical protein